MICTIRCVAGALEGGSILANQTLPIGSNPSAAIRLPTADAEQWHCCLVVGSDGALTLIDLATPTGTFVNGAHIRRQRLKVFDRFSVGSAHFEVVPTEMDEDETVRHGAGFSSLPPAPEGMVASLKTGSR